MSSDHLQNMFKVTNCSLRSQTAQPTRVRFGCLTLSPDRRHSYSATMHVDSPHPRSHLTVNGYCVSDLPREPNQKITTLIFLLSILMVQGFSKSPFTRAPMPLLVGPLTVNPFIFFLRGEMPKGAIISGALI